MFRGDTADDERGRRDRFQCLTAIRLRTGAEGVGQRRF